MKIPTRHKLHDYVCNGQLLMTLDMPITFICLQYLKRNKQILTLKLMK